VPVSIKLKELSLTKVQLSVTVPAEHVRKAFRSVYRELSREGRVPGFRPGKVPPEVLRRHYGEDSIKAQVIRDLAPDAYSAAVERAGIRPLEQPDFGKIDVREDGPLTLSAKVTVLPRVKPEQYKGLKLRRPVTEITDKDIDEEIDELRNQGAGWADTDRDEIRKGDLVTADVTIEVEGHEPVALEDAEYEVGSEKHVPPIDRGFVHARLGQTLTIDTSYPGDYGEAELAGKEAKATAVLKSLREWRVPEADDQFAKANYGFDTVGELREDIRKNLAANAVTRAEEELRQQALAALTAQVEVEVPRDLALAEAKERIATLERAVRQQGLRLEDVLRGKEIDRAHLHEAEVESARRSVARVLVLDAVGRAEDIDASDEEVEAEIAKRAERQGTEASEARAQLERADLLDDLRHQMRTEKILEFLVANAEIEEVPLDDYLAEKGKQELAEGKEEAPEGTEPETVSTEAAAEEPAEATAQADAPVEEAPAP
jgi:trigger factor